MQKKHKSVKSNLINRCGSKATDIKFFSHILPYDVKNVVEVFGGGYSVIKTCYRDDGYNLYANDNDKQLYHIYTNAEKYKDFVNHIMEKYEDVELINKDVKNDFLQYVKDFQINQVMKDFFIKSFCVKGNLIRLKKKNDYKDELDLIDKIDFTNDDYKKVFSRFKNDTEAFLFLDPPYLFSNNIYYESQENEPDITEMIIEILNFIKIARCKIMLVINDNFILRHLFNDYIKFDYDKIYALTKKHTKHLVITNY